MSAKKKQAPLPKRSGASAANVQASAVDAAAAVAELKKLGSKPTRDGMARYGIPSDGAFGVPVGTIRQLGKRFGPSHELALDLARRLAESDDASARWVGKDALRDLGKPATLRRVAKADQRR